VLVLLEETLGGYGVHGPGRLRCPGIVLRVYDMVFARRATCGSVVLNMLCDRPLAVTSYCPDLRHSSAFVGSDLVSSRAFPCSLSLVST
jgi:hypothetical protein